MSERFRGVLVGMMSAVSGSRRAVVRALVLPLLLCMAVGACTTQTPGSSTARAASSPEQASPAGASAGSAARGAGPSVLTPVTAEVTAPPSPVTGTDGRVHLAYELLLTNTGQQPATIRSVRVLAGDRTLQALRGDALGAWFKALGAQREGTRLAPGQQGILWLDATVGSPAEVPTGLHHVIGVEFASPTPPLIPKRLDERVADIPVQTAAPVVIAPPLDGPRWLDGNGCCTVTAHRAAVSPLNGSLWAPERFAIDFVQLDRQNRLFSGSKTKLSSYRYFGTQVHAVADGEVVAVVSNLEEQVPGASPTGLPLDQYGGNHVVQDIGGGRFAFYAHLQPGSTAGVAVGQRLRAGQVVGLLGNTGNTDAPHLHFHIMDSPDPLASNGLPFVVAGFDRTARVRSGTDLDRALADGSAVRFAPGARSGRQSDEMPLFLDVLTFDAGS